MDERKLVKIGIKSFVAGFIGLWIQLLLTAWAWFAKAERIYEQLAHGFAGMNFLIISCALLGIGVLLVFSFKDRVIEIVE